MTATDAMFTKLFNKDESPDKTKAAVPAPAPSPPPDKGPWEEQLRVAAGNDEALLAVAKSAPFIDIKHAAVQQLSGEDALKQAEREFRNHDRRVHREAKQRWEAKVAEREARAQAAQLIDTAEALVQEASIPANRLVELDRAWHLLNSALLDDAQNAAYADVWTRLTTLARERGDQQLWTKRWLADANRALAQFNTVCLQVARGDKERADLAPVRAGIEATLSALLAAADAANAAPSIVHLQAALCAALQLAADTDARLAFLESLPAAADGTQAAAWQALAIGDATVAAALNGRFEQWQREQTDARQARSAEAKKQAGEQNKAARQARLDEVEALLNQAETALAAGHLAETIEFLRKLDDAASFAHPDKKMQARIEAVQGEAARLKGWQHWGGGRVRDDLVLEAEALAKASAAEKLAIKAHADAIDNLRERWKELDKLGGATNRTLWLRFDAALKTAYLPVAAHLAKLKAARQENLDARKQLIAALDAVVLADAEKGESQDWRALARILEQFQTDWRKLGPVEHTVPHKARSALETRQTASVERLDAPLREVRRVEQLKRSKLIERAKALAADSAARDVIAKVRELQTEWQQHAKGLPLARHEENKLWADFKSATDAVFKQRDALHAARDGELKVHQASREALIGRLAALTADTPAGELKRALGDIDREWRNGGEAPRAVAAKLDAAFRAARDKAQQHLAGSGKRVWHATCDALAAKLAMCEEIESATSAADIDVRWQAIAALPAPWEKALQARFKSALENPAGSGATPTAADAPGASLLQLEAALGVESPPAFQTARRDLKLRAMKNALEARQSAGVSAADIDRWLAEVFGVARADDLSRQRLRAIVAALREGSHRGS
ncbi:MAG: DUF349 domain-containing protein [Betaproteobacteria bacterium]